MRKQEKLDVMLKKKNQVRPESPGTRRRKLKRNNSMPLKRSNSKLNEVSFTILFQKFISTVLGLDLDFV